MEDLAGPDLLSGVTAGAEVGVPQLWGVWWQPTVSGVFLLRRLEETPQQVSDQQWRRGWSEMVVGHAPWTHPMRGEWGVSEAPGQTGS